MNTSFSEASNDPKRYLNETTYINYSASSIQAVVAKVTTPNQLPREKAIALHDYVRDNIRFGFEGNFYNMKASEVLAAGRGYCNTKSTLLIALLRAADIPARHRFYGLSSQVLSGILNPGTAYVDHSIIEVYLDGRWVRTDSYIADPKLFAGASQIMSAPLGQGIRRDGSNIWDGHTDSFSQYHPSYISREFGIYEDVGDFYANASNPYNKLNLVSRILASSAFGNANERIEAIRMKP